MDGLATTVVDGLMGVFLALSDLRSAIDPSSRYTVRLASYWQKA